MSGRFVVLVVTLAVVSAAVGAGAALLLQPEDDHTQTASLVTVATTTTRADASEHQEMEPVKQADTQAERSATNADPPSTTAQQQSPPEQQASDDDLQVRADQQASVEPSEEDAPGDPQPGPTDDALGEDAPAETRPLFVASLSPNLLTQGEALSLTVESHDASAVAATIGSRSWNLIETAPGLWWTVIAIPRDADTGITAVAVDLYGEGGAWLRSVSESIVVLANAAPLEEITLGGAGTPADPAEVARDIAVRFSEHISVSGPPRWDGPWILPVQGEVTGVFGAQRTYDGVEAQGWHHGHDIAAQHGDPIVAPAPGTIVWTGEVILHGIGVIIDHGAGVYSGYWHMSLIAVREGMEVAPGDWIGNIGNTGLSTGPHLHWEVIIQGVDVDPVQWLGEDQPSLPPVAPEPQQSADTIE